MSQPQPPHETIELKSLPNERTGTGMLTVTLLYPQ
jgi:hypothetical protein